MRGPPVVLTNTLGRPVTNVISERGAVPMTVVNTLGEPVTLVASGGEPVTLFNENGTLWDYPVSLFSNNEQGAWYDPSDFSTLFQNSTGTTPVTAVEQPVRLMLDRSGRGNHALAPNDASRPVLRARYNQITFSEQFDNAAWQKNDGSSVTANAVVAPDGTTTADQINLSASELSRVQQALSGQPTASYTFAVWLRVASGSVSVRFGHSADIDVITITDTWQRFTSTKTVTSPSQPNLTIRNEAGGGAKTLYAWGAQLLSAADQTATGGAYQRIAAATDYDTSNPVWRPYLAFDGSDDSLSTSSIDFSGTDEMTVFAGVTKLSDAAGSVVLGHGVDDGTVGAFEFRANTAVNATTAFRGRSSAGSTATAGFTRDIAAPSTFVFASLVDYAAAAGAEFSGRYNGVVQAQTVGLTQENTGTFGNNVLTIGSRQGGALQLFNGRLYSLAVLGRTATVPELSAMEAWVAGKTGVTI